MEPDSFPPGGVRVLLQSGRVTPATRAALLPRLERSVASPQYFDVRTLALLRAICVRLIPQPEGDVPPLDLAGGIDARLAEGKGDGWRYDALPQDGDAYRQGLQGVDESARLVHGKAFVDLTGSAQDAILHAVQQSDAPGEVWKTLPGPRFLEELLAEVAECYYSDPLTQEEIGYVGMADARGWTRIGLDDREPQEDGHD